MKKYLILLALALAGVLRASTPTPTSTPTPPSSPTLFAFYDGESGMRLTNTSGTGPSYDASFHSGTTGGGNPSSPLPVPFGNLWFSNSNFSGTPEDQNAIDYPLICIPNTNKFCFSFTFNIDGVSSSDEVSPIEIDNQNSFDSVYISFFNSSKHFTVNYNSISSSVAVDIPVTENMNHQFNFRYDNGTLICYLDDSIVVNESGLVDLKPLRNTLFFAIPNGNQDGVFIDGIAFASDPAALPLYPSATPSPTFSFSPTSSPTFSISPTHTISPTITQTFTASPTPTPTVTITQTFANTATPNPTQTPHVVAYDNSKVALASPNLAAPSTSFTMGSGISPILLVHVFTGRDQASDHVVKVTYGGLTATKLLSNKSDAGSYLYELDTYLVKNPPTGSNTITVYLSASQTVATLIGAQSYFNVGSVSNISGANRITSNTLSKTFYTGVNGSSLAGCFAIHDETSAPFIWANPMMTTRKSQASTLFLENYYVNLGDVRNYGASSIPVNWGFTGNPDPAMMNYLELVPR